MEQRIFGCVRRKIADLSQLKQIGYKANARCDDERRKYPPNPARVKFQEGEGAGFDLRKNDTGDQEITKKTSTPINPPGTSQGCA